MSSELKCSALLQVIKQWHENEALHEASETAQQVKAQATEAWWPGRDHIKVQGEN